MKQIPCPACKGEGILRKVAEGSTSQFPIAHRRSCPRCHGNGTIEAEPFFVAVGFIVRVGRDTIARAVSKTMAKRIANALNKHKPNSEGV